MSLCVVVLAAGAGTRMRSSLPKVLHPMAGRPMLDHVIGTAQALAPRSIHVVYGFGGDQVQAAMAHREVQWHEQAEQLGTGHAVMQAIGAIADDARVLVLYGDVPLLRQGTLEALVETSGDDGLAVLTVHAADPTGYGRIVRSDDGQVQQIVEHKDASDAQRVITEVNTGVMAMPAKHLRDWLGQLGKDNAQGEYYLTDIVELAARDGRPVSAVVAGEEAETLGVNDKVHLAQAEAEHRRRTALSLMQAGVTLLDPGRIDVRGELQCGRDVVIDVNAVFVGNVSLGDGVQIGANVVITDSALGAGTVVHPNSVIEKAEIGAACQIGPFARVRPDTHLSDRVRLGNFVEVKKSRIDEGSKVNHLTYVGDAEIGRDVNVGAGTVTCNYDGANKHLTRLGDRVFIGSGSMLVAPVEVGAGATIGAGSVVSKDAPPEKLTVSRAKQVTIDGWRRPQKKPK